MSQVRFHCALSVVVNPKPGAPAGFKPTSWTPEIMLRAPPTPAPMKGVKHHQVPRSTYAFARNTADEMLPCMTSEQVPPGQNSTKLPVALKPARVRYSPVTSNRSQLFQA